MSYCLNIKNKQPVPETVAPKKHEVGAPIFKGRQKPAANSINRNNSLIKVQESGPIPLSSHPSVPSLPDLTSLSK